MNRAELQSWLQSDKRRAFLAPMAGVTDAAYRSMYVGHADLCYTEMVSATGLSYGSQPTRDLCTPHEKEGRFAIQLFGHDPYCMTKEAARLCEDFGERLVLIDVNMACPVAKVVRKGEGSALLGQLDLAAEIIKSMADELPCAVTAKIRTGIRKDEPLYLEAGRVLEQAGAAALALHGRSAGQGYRGESDRESIEKLAAALSIPLIGSGDVMSAADAIELYDKGCAAVFVARGSYGNPWIFDQIKGLRTEGPSLKERVAAAREHLHRAIELGVHMGRMRKIIAWYLKGAPHAASVRAKTMSCDCAQDFIALLDEIESWS